AAAPAGSLFFFAAAGFLPGCTAGASSGLACLPRCFFSCVTFFACATLRGSDIRPHRKVLGGRRKTESVATPVRRNKRITCRPSISAQTRESNRTPPATAEHGEEPGCHGSSLCQL